MSSLKDKIGQWVNLEISIDNVSKQVDMFVDGEPESTHVIDRRITKGSGSRFTIGSTKDRKKGFRGRFQNFEVKKGKATREMVKLRYQNKTKKSRTLFNMDFKNVVGSGSSRKFLDKGKKRMQVKSSGEFSTAPTVSQVSGSDAVALSIDESSGQGGLVVEETGGTFQNLEKSTFSAMVKLPAGHARDGFEPIMSKSDKFAFGVHEGKAALYMANQGNLVPYLGEKQEDSDVVKADDDLLVEASFDGSSKYVSVEGTPEYALGINKSKAVKNEIKVNKNAIYGKDLDSFAVSMWVNPNESKEATLFERPDVGLKLSADTQGALSLESKPLNVVPGVRYVRFETDGNMRIGNEEEFPPAPLTAQETTLDGHGVFKASHGTNKAGGGEGYLAFNKIAFERGWHGDATTTSNGQYENMKYVGNITHAGGIKGDYIQLELPYAIRVTRSVLYPRPLNNYWKRMPSKGTILGSMDGSTWETVGNWINEKYVEKQAKEIVHNSTGYYKIFRLVVEEIEANNSYTEPSNIGEWKLFGTRYQNVDLSMKTLGAGIIEEFPPKAMTGQNTWIEGYGIFTATASSKHNLNPGYDEPFHLFRKDAISANYWTQYGGKYDGDDNRYTANVKTGDQSGDWVQLTLPFKIRLTGVSVGSSNIGGRWAKDAAIMGTNDGSTWTRVGGWTNIPTPGNFVSKFFQMDDSSECFKTYRMVILKTDGNPYVTLTEFRLHGIREAPAYNPGKIALREIKVKDVDGEVISTNAAATSSTYDAGSLPLNINDDDLSTVLSTSYKSGSNFVEIDLGKEYDVGSVELYNVNDEDTYVYDFEVIIANGNSSWGPHINAIYLDGTILQDDTPNVKVDLFSTVDDSTKDKFSGAYVVPGKLGMLDANWQSWTRFGVKSDWTLGQKKLMTITTKQKVSSFRISYLRPGYVPGFEIFENGISVYRDTANAGAASTPMYTERTYAIPPINIRYHQLQEFPPYSMGEGLTKYFAGHGVYEIVTSGYNGTGPTWRAFNKVGGDFWYFNTGLWTGSQPRNPGGFSAGGADVEPPYDYGGTATFNGISGEWVQMNFPYYVDIKSIGITCRDGHPQTGPNSGIFFGSTDKGLSWFELTRFKDKIPGFWRQGAVESPRFDVSPSRLVNSIALVVTRANNWYAPNIGELRFYGSRTQRRVDRLAESGGKLVLKDRLGEILNTSRPVPWYGPGYGREVYTYSYDTNSWNGTIVYEFIVTESSSHSTIDSSIAEMTVDGRRIKPNELEWVHTADYHGGSGFEPSHLAVDGNMSTAAAWSKSDESPAFRRGETLFKLHMDEEIDEFDIVYYRPCYQVGFKILKNGVEIHRDEGIRLNYVIRPQPYPIKYYLSSYKKRDAIVEVNPISTRESMYLSWDAGDRSSYAGDMSVTVNDISANEHVGTLTNMNFENVYESWKFNGSSSITTTLGADFVGNIQHTASCWFRLDSLDEEMTIYSIAPTSGEANANNKLSHVRIGNTPGYSLSWHFGNNDVRYALPNHGRIKAGRWYHLAAVHATNTLKKFPEVALTSNASGGYKVTASSYFNHGNHFPWRAFDKNISDVTGWNTALPNNVGYLYDATPLRDQLLVEFNTVTSPMLENSAIENTASAGAVDGTVNLATHNAGDKSIYTNTNVGTHNSGPKGNIANHLNNYGSVEVSLANLEGDMPTLTVCGWFLFDQMTSLNIAWMIGPESGIPQAGKMYWFGVQNGQGRLAIGSGDGRDMNIYYDNLFSTGSWHHIAITINPKQNNGGSIHMNDCKLYLNGKFRPSSSYNRENTDPAIMPIKVGADEEKRLFIGWQEASDVYFQGRIAGFKLYDVALDEVHFRSLYAAGRYPKIHISPAYPPTGLVSGLDSYTRGVNGEYITLEMPKAIRLQHFVIKARQGYAGSPNDHPRSGHLYGSMDGQVWTHVVNFDNLTYASGQEKIMVNTQCYFKFFRLQARSRVGAYSTDVWICIGDIEYFGYPDESGLTKFPQVPLTSNEEDGHKVTASSVVAHHRHQPFRSFDRLLETDEFMGWNSSTPSSYYAQDKGISGTIGATTSAALFEGHRGEHITIELPTPIRVEYFTLFSRTGYAGSPNDHPGRGFLYGSNDGEKWDRLAAFENLTYGGVPHGNETVFVGSKQYYKHIRLQATARVGGGSDWVCIGEIEYIGYPQGVAVTENAPIEERRFYIDGKPCPIVDTDGSNYGEALNIEPSSKLAIGSRVDSKDTLRGSIAEFKLFDKAFSLAEVQELHLSNAGRYDVRPVVKYPSKPLKSSKDGGYVVTTSNEIGQGTPGSADFLAYRAFDSYIGRTGGWATQDGYDASNGYALATPSAKTADVLTYVFPPGPLTDFVTEIVEHGTFVVDSSGDYGKNETKAWRAFNQTRDSSAGDDGNSWDSRQNVYASSGKPRPALPDKAALFDGEYGEWISVRMPYGIRVNSYTYLARMDRDHEAPASGILYASNDGFETYERIHEFTNVEVPGVNQGATVTHTVGETRFFNEYRFQVTATEESPYCNIAQLHFSGQRYSELAPVIYGNRGHWIDLELPQPIALKYLQIIARNFDNTRTPAAQPGEGFIYGSNDKTTWSQIGSFTGLTYGGMNKKIDATPEYVRVDSDVYYKHIRFQATRRAGQNGSDEFMMLGELCYFGVPKTLINTHCDGMSFDNPAPSATYLATMNMPNGYYYIRPPGQDQVGLVFCDLDGSASGIGEGGWMRIGYSADKYTRAAPWSGVGSDPAFADSGRFQLEFNDSFVGAMRKSAVEIRQTIDSYAKGSVGWTYGDGSNMGAKLFDGTSYASTSGGLNLPSDVELGFEGWDVHGLKNPMKGGSTGLVRGTDPTDANDNDYWIRGLAYFVERKDTHYKNWRLPVTNILNRDVDNSEEKRYFPLQSGGASFVWIKSQVGSGLDQNDPAPSAAHLMTLGYSTGTYWIRPPGHHEARQVFCDLDGSESQILTGGWMRVEYTADRYNRSSFLHSQSSWGSSGRFSLSHPDDFIRAMTANANEVRQSIDSWGWGSVGWSYSNGSHMGSKTIDGALHQGTGTHSWADMGFNGWDKDGLVSPHGTDPTDNNDQVWRRGMAWIRQYEDDGKNLKLPIVEVYNADVNNVNERRYWPLQSSESSYIWIR